MVKARITHVLLADFENYLREQEKSEATVQKYMRDVRSLARFARGRELDKILVTGYKAKLRNEYSLLGANSMLAAVNNFLRFLGRTDLCVRQFKIQKKSYCSEEQELSKAEYLRLVHAAEDSKNMRLSMVIQTICGTGIRVSELEYITVEAVKKGEATVACKGKVRTVFIVSKLRKKLLEYAKCHGIKSGIIFITKNGKVLNRSNIWKDMKKLCALAKVNPKKVFPHNLRHLFARTFYGVEKDIAKLADILGHSSIDTTRIYIMSTGAEHRRKIENMHLII